MPDLYKTKELVAVALSTEEETRNDDIKLYTAVCRMINPKIEDLRFGTVMNNMYGLKIPHFETVRRIRQKLQHDEPETYGCNIFTQKQRDKKEKEYLEFARS